MANKLLSYIRTKTGEKHSTRNGAGGPFVKANGLKHDAFFQSIHQTFLFDWYMEIGCRSGAIFSQVRGKTVAVDPYFQVTRNVIGSKPALHLFQTKSDDFFELGFLKKNAIAVSASFLDGMHLMEYLLRDFINAERNSHPNGVIAMHDCCPYDALMTTRDLKNLPTGSWTGAGKRSTIMRPDVTVPVVTNTAASGRKRPSSRMSGNTETDSPTLAACTQINGPFGRTRPGRPKRSGSRSSSSFPCASRCRSKRAVQVSH